MTSPDDSANKASGDNQAATLLKAESVGFLKALFDTRFNHYVTPKIARVVYIVLIAVHVGAWLLLAVRMLDLSAGAGFLVLLLGWIPALLLLALARVAMESTVALVSIADKVGAFAARAGIR